ncbi:MAG: hypothetical protein IPK79_06190 [Vampirovibrionales bacterium]|nr:hypothetical protein [Vampirovibrionales bacterium]
MSFEPFAKFAPIAETLSGLSYSQQLVSSNIANAQTPGYTAKNVSFADVISSQNSPFETRLSKEMGKTCQPLSMVDSGEPVNLQQQMILMQKNMLFYSMATRRAATIFNTLRTASQIGR